MVSPARLAVLSALALAGAAWAGPPYRVQADENGVWAFVDGQGKRFVSLGVNNIAHEPFRPRPGTKFYLPIQNQFNGDAGAWGRFVHTLLTDHGFNTVGCWSSPLAPDGAGPGGTFLYRTPILYVVGTEADRCLAPLRPDLEGVIRRNTREMMAKFPNREALLGVFLDNEAAWWGLTGWDKVATNTLMERALRLPKDDKAYGGTILWLKGRYPSPAAMGEAWGRPLKSWTELDGAWAEACYTDASQRDRDDFTTMLADSLFATAERVVREELPGVLLLGVRFAGDAPLGVIKAAGRHNDVISINMYRSEPAADRTALSRYWLLTGRPLMVTEFSWRAEQNGSGNPNTRGAGPVVKTQRERGEAYAKFVPDHYRLPVVIGTHWFEFQDQSPQGRFDGEDSNYGIVDIENRPYTELLSAMKAAHATIPAIRADSMEKMASELPKEKTVTYSPGQHPDRPPVMPLFAGPWAKDPEAFGARDAGMGWSRRGDTIVLGFDTGSDWGCGVKFHGPISRRTRGGPEWATDLDGYTDFVIDLEAPAGLQINVTLDEAAVGQPGQAKYSVGLGDDGEGYISLPMFAAGGRQTLRVPIKTLQTQMFWGNQGGGRVIEMNAVRSFGVQVRGRPQKGEIVLHSFRLER